MWLVRLGGRLASTIETTWETTVFRRSDRRDVLYPGSTAAFVAVCFANNGEVDRLALSQSNNGRVIIRTLGQRFKREEVAKITYYKCPGVLVEFEDVGEVYDQCRYEDVMEPAA